MKILIRRPKGNRHSTSVIKALIEGIECCGDVLVGDKMLKGPVLINKAYNYDAVALWSGRHLNHIKPIIDAGMDILMCELGYIGNRREWISIGWNGINGKAEFLIGKEHRWKKIWGKDILKPWNMNYDHALIIGQCAKDISVSDCPSVLKWYEEMTKECLALNLSVIFRRHPLDIWTAKNYCPKGATLDSSESIDEAMQNALVITYSSNVGVLATLAGRPIVAQNRTSMVYGLAAKNIKDVKAFDRKPWLHKMAYCQWHIDELRDGTAWRYLRTKYLDNQT